MGALIIGALRPDFWKLPYNIDCDSYHDAVGTLVRARSGSLNFYAAWRAPRTPNYILDAIPHVP